MGLLLLIIVLVLVFGGLPRWGYHSYGYAPSGIGAVLDGANFLHADLRRVYNLERASLEQALYNEQTVFPNGFNPYFRGMLDVAS